MGEDTFIYSDPQSTPYSHSLPVRLENREGSPGMVPYHIGISEPFCAEQNVMANNVIDKSYHEDMMEDYSDGRPQLHHMPSVSTTCTSDSFHSSLPSGDSGDAFDLNGTDTQEFEWSMHSANSFQWPANRISQH